MSGTPEQSVKAFEDLKVELKKATFNDSALASKLVQVKTVARDPIKAPYVFCKEGLSVLAEAAFGPHHEQRPTTSLEAAKIIANTLLLRDQMQQVFSELGYATSLLGFFSQPDPDHEFVGGRILFLLTYKSNTDFVALIESQNLISHLNEHLVKHHASISTNNFAGNPMNSMALVESLKLLYNLASKYPQQMLCFSPTAIAMMGIVSDIRLGTEPLSPPLPQLLNALALIDWVINEDGSQDETVLHLSRRLVEILGQCTSSLQPGQMETMLVPLITVLRKLTEVSHSATNEFLKLNLLPQDEERDKPLGQSETLASRLLRLQTSGGLIILPEAISGLLFDLSDHDATKFVHHIGYGHAAGYLMTHKIPIPQELQASAVKTGGDVNMLINPVTGQRIDAETAVDMPEMTDEEKEREAERLFILFKRLKATGIVGVENPLRAGQQSGRFEELSDSESD